MTPEERAQVIHALMHGLSDKYPDTGLKPSEKILVYSARRRLALEKLKEYDLSPHDWADYPTIMREEIRNRITILKRIYERRWDEFRADTRAKQLLATYTELLPSQYGQPMESRTDRSIWLKGKAVQIVCRDLYQLGNLEAMVNGVVHYGFETPD